MDDGRCDDGRGDEVCLDTELKKVLIADTGIA
jgi:hypothetical protein